MTLIGILAILLMVGTISSQSYAKKEFGNEKVEQARTTPTNNTLSWFDKELEKSTAAEAEKPKSTAAEKPETSAQAEPNKEVEGSITQGQQLGNSQIKVENQHIDTGTLHTKESARELAMASQAKVERAPTTPTTPTTKESSQAKVNEYAPTTPVGGGLEGEVKGVGRSPCPAGQVRDWADICWDKSVAKACPTCELGSAQYGIGTAAIQEAKDRAYIEHVQRTKSCIPAQNGEPEWGYCSGEVFRPPPNGWHTPHDFRYKVPTCTSSRTCS